MILPNIETYENISAKQMLENLRIFASSCGWYEITWAPDADWIYSSSLSKYIWTTPSNPDDKGHFLEIESSGWGAQVLNFRLYVQSGFADTRAEKMYLSGTNPTNTIIDDQSPTKPYYQNRVTKYVGSTIPANILRCWFFGNEKFLAIFMEASSSVVQNFMLGTFDLFDTTISNELLYTPSLGYQSTSTWYSNGIFDAPDQYIQATYFDNAIRDIVLNCYASSASTFGWYGENLKAYRRGISNLNSYIGIATPMLKPLVYVIDSANVYRPIGTLPIFRFPKPNAIKNGTKITNGTKEFYVFQGIYKTNNGIAIRTA